MRQLLVLCAVLFATAIPAQAQPSCGPREQVLQMLTGDKYAERGMLELSSEDGLRVIHLYGNPTTGTWSLVNFPQPAIACIFAIGKGIEPMSGKPSEPPVNPS